MVLDRAAGKVEFGEGALRLNGWQSDAKSRCGDAGPPRPGASSGPLVALRVLNGLIAAGVTDVNAPTCVTCRRPQRHFVVVVDDGRQCCDCRQAVLREPCAG